MTLKTVTGPTIRTALADARRLFGDDAVLLQSTPPAPGAPASVTVAFDVPSARATAAPAPQRTVTPWTVPAAEPASAASPRAYGYGGVTHGGGQKVPAAESLSAPAVAPTTSAPVTPPVMPVAAPVTQTPAAPVMPPVAAPVVSPAAPVMPPATPESATADELARLRARLARLEAALADARVPVPTAPAPVVLVGPAGSGKTSLALRLGRAPGALDAASAAVLVVAPEDGPWLDPSPLLWTLGVPAVVVRTPDDVRAALDTLAEAELLIVDTPALPLAPERARPAVARLGALLAPLAPVDVHLVLDAARPASALPDLATLGLRPDALALTRLDEAPAGAAADAPARLGLPLRLTSAGPDATHFAVADPAAVAPPPTPSLAATVRAVLPEPAPAFADFV